MNKQIGKIDAGLAAIGFFALLAVLSVGGWIANVVKMVGMDLGVMSGMLVARAIGIVIAPLRAVLGYI